MDERDEETDRVCPPPRTMTMHLRAMGFDALYFYVEQLNLNC